MDTLQSLFPDADMLLAIEPETLAPILLKLARRYIQNGMFFPDTVTEMGSPGGIAALNNPFPHHPREAVEAAFNEAWNWLRTNSLIAPAPGMNGRNGLMIITRSGQEIADDQDLERFKAARAFPKSLLHPSIADKVWAKLVRADLAEAVLIAFRTVEEAVRKAGGFGPTDCGVQLMRKAFDKTTGPLTDRSRPEPEREALAHLFAGAIGYYKNPHSHRTVDLTDVREAQQQVMLATHLLSIVDTRRPKPFTTVGATVHS